MYSRHAYLVLHCNNQRASQPPSTGKIVPWT
jgi:hypothetical protein